MTPEEILRILNCPELRWQDVPNGDALVKAALSGIGDRHISEIIQTHAQIQQGIAMESGNPFWGNYPSLKEPTSGEIEVIQLPTGQTLRISKGAPCRNVLIFGPPGAAKTSFLRQFLYQCVHSGVSCVALDSKDHRESLLDCREFQNPVFPALDIHASELQLGFVQWPSGVTQEHGVLQIVEEFARSFSLEASRRLLIDKIHEALQQNERPTLREVIDRVGKSATRYNESLLPALKELQLSLGKSLSFRSSDMLARLCEYPGLVVVRTAGLSDRVKSWLASRFISWEFQRRGVPKTDCSRPVLFCIDDALGLVSGSWKQADPSATPVSDWSLLGRSRNTGIVVASHSFSAISPILRGNSSTLVCCGSSGKDAEEVSRHFHLTREQYQRLLALQPGEAVVLARTSCHLPLLGTFPYLQENTSETNHPRKRAAELLQKVKSVRDDQLEHQDTQRPAQTKGQQFQGQDKQRSTAHQHSKHETTSASETKRSLSEHELLLLISISQKPWLTLTEHYEASGIHGMHGKRAKDNLNAKGFVKLHSRARKGRGKAPTVVEILKPGKEFLKKKELSVKELKGRGSFLARLYARDLVEQKKDECSEVFLDRKYGDKHPDAGGVYKDGRVWIAEVVLSGTARHNADGIIRGASQEGIAQVIVIAINNKLLERIRVKIEQDMLGSNVAEKVKYLHAGELYQERTIAT